MDTMNDVKIVKLENKDVIEIIENAFSYVVAFGMLAYGVAKIIQFNGATDINKTVSELTGMQLMWAFYGYSKPFVVILGILEITGGILMLLKRTRILGCFLATTILTNVILQDIFYKVNVGALRAAIIYQSLILVSLWFNRVRLLKALKILTSPQIITNSKIDLFLKLLFSIILFVFLRILEHYITMKW